MVTVGITGGIGSGKSTVCKVWAGMGGYILNADELAKELMVSDKQIRSRLTEAFGDRTYKEDDTLNRTYLAGEAFGKGRVRELNEIVHPRLPSAVRQRMQSAAEKGFEVGVYEAALLLESKHLEQFDYLVLVLADDERRLQWVRDRDGVSRQDVKNRMDKQRNFQEAAEQVDIVMRNEGSLEELKKNARDVYNYFLH